MSTRALQSLLLAAFFFANAACGGGGGGGSGVSLRQIGNPGASGLLTINASASTGSIEVEQGGQASFTVTAEVINQGTSSRGLTITANQGCLRYSACRSQPFEFPTRGTSTVTIYTTMNTPVGEHILEVLVYEEHYTALGWLGSRVRVSKAVPIAVTVTPTPAAIEFANLSTLSTSSIEHSGDFDGDTVDDLLVASSRGMFELLLGAPSGDFESIDIDFGALSPRHASC